MMILELFLKTKKKRGYLSSNRVGSKGDDIYRFNLPTLNLTLSGVITDLKTKQIIPGATIDIVGSDSSTFKLLQIIQVDIFLMKISLKKMYPIT